MSVIFAVLAGIVAGAVPLAAYAYGTAEMIWPYWLAEYLALGLVLVASIVAVAVTAALLRWRHVHGRIAFVLALVVSLLVVYGLASVIRVYPPAELGTQLPGYATWSPSLDRVMSAVNSQNVPVLGGMLGATELQAILGAEAVLLLGLVLVLSVRSLAVPYCHACRRRCELMPGVHQFTTDSRRETVERVLARDWGHVRVLGAPGTSRGKIRLRFDMATCTQCKRTNLLFMTQVRKLLRNKQLIKDMRLTDDDVRTVKALNQPSTA
jgi:hypothetical protein